FQGMTGRLTLVVEGADELDGGEAANVAIEIAAVGDGIDMRAKENWWKGFGPRSAAEDIAGRIDADFEAGVFHQADDVRATREVGFGEADAADAAFGVLSEFGEFLQGLPEAVLVDVTPSWLLREGSCCRERKSKQKPCDK